MSPLELILNNIHKAWQCRGQLRKHSTDSQICGYFYCAEGKICDIYLKHAPEHAKKYNARWADIFFEWEEKDGFGFVQKYHTHQFMPSPVLDWIDSVHGNG